MATIPSTRKKTRCHFPICQSVYTNVKTGQTSSERPECDPYFVDTDLFLKFTPEEIETLSEVLHTLSVNLQTYLLALDPRPLFGVSSCPRVF